MVMHLENQGSGNTIKGFTRKLLHDIVRASTQKHFDRKLSDLEDKLLALTKCPPSKTEEFHKVINSFKIVYKRHWQACKSTENNSKRQPMSPTVHKILMHSTSVIKHALLPIGQLSEEASEARNKHFRKYRESYSRKFSRKECLEDVFNRLLLTSYPYFSSIRHRFSKKKPAVSQEALDFIVSPTVGFESDDEA